MGFKFKTNREKTNSKTSRRNFYYARMTETLLLWVLRICLGKKQQHTNVISTNVFHVLYFISFRPHMSVFWRTFSIHQTLAAILTQVADLNVVCSLYLQFSALYLYFLSVRNYNQKSNEFCLLSIIFL